jgi:hypothetical protein
MQSVASSAYRSGRLENAIGCAVGEQPTLSPDFPRCRMQLTPRYFSHLLCRWKKLFKGHIFFTLKVISSEKSRYTSFKVIRRFGGHVDSIFTVLEETNDCYLHHSGFLLCLFSPLKIKATYSSETSVEFQRTTWRYI